MVEELRGNVSRMVEMCWLGCIPNGRGKLGQGIGACGYLFPAWIDVEHPSNFSGGAPSSPSQAAYGPLQGGNRVPGYCAR